MASSGKRRCCASRTPNATSIPSHGTTATLQAPRTLSLTDTVTNQNNPTPGRRNRRTRKRRQGRHRGRPPVAERVGVPHDQQERPSPSTPTQPTAVQPGRQAACGRRHLRRDRPDHAAVERAGQLRLSRYRIADAERRQQRPASDAVARHLPGSVVNLPIAEVAGRLAVACARSTRSTSTPRTPSSRPATRSPTCSLSTPNRHPTLRFNAYNPMDEVYIRNGTTTAAATTW